MTNMLRRGSEAIGHRPLGAPVLPRSNLRHAVAADATILTARGCMPLQEIHQGDRVVTRDHGMVTVRQVIQTETDLHTHIVFISAGALGHKRPDHTTRVALDQPISLRGWRAETLFGAKEARVAAARLVDGQIIRLCDSVATAFVSIILDRPAVLYINGLQLVSASLTAQRP